MYNPLVAITKISQSQSLSANRPLLWLIHTVRYFLIATAIPLVATNGLYRTQWKCSHYVTAIKSPVPIQPIISKNKSQSKSEKNAQCKRAFITRNRFYVRYKQTLDLRPFSCLTNDVFHTHDNKRHNFARHYLSLVQEAITIQYYIPKYTTHLSTFSLRIKWKL